MGIFSFSKKKQSSVGPISPQSAADASMLAQLVLNTIHDGIVIVDKDKVIRYINPAAVTMIGFNSSSDAVGLDFSLILKFETTDGDTVDDNDNELVRAINNNTAFESREFVLLSKQGDRKTPIAIALTPSGDTRSDRIITFRNISKELEEEGAQTEFVSTASHEMRTPVASIEGYLGLALNPQTATIDDRARQYLESAHSASQHLGRLFQDLLDVTKLDDKRIRPHPIPLELSGFVKKFADEYIPKFQEKKITYSFGASNKKESKRNLFAARVLEQVVYTFVDPDFLGEILANLIENAIKYTPEGGAVWVNVQGDGDRALINVTDTGIGISSDDLQHVFQKFYRADNSHTRTVGGTGLGLYLVKQRTEAMNGKVWAESAFGEGSTFYVSLPRLTGEEYEKRQIAVENEKAVAMFQAQVKTADDIAAQKSSSASSSVPVFDPSLITNSGTAEPAPEPVATSATPPEPQTPPEQPVQSTVASPQVTAQQQADVPSPSQSQPQVVTETAQSVMSPSQTAPMIQYGQMQYAQAIPNQFSAPSQQVPVATPLPAQNSVQPQSLSSPPAIPPSQPVAAVNYQLTQQKSVQNNQNTLQ